MINLWRAHSEFYGNLMRHKRLVWNLAKRDLVARYKGSVLGFLWTIVNPLLLMLTYSIVFSFISRFEIPAYPLYVLLGILVWQTIANSINESATSIHGAGGLVTKTPLPPEIIPAKVVLSQFLNFCLAFTVYFTFAALVYQRVSWQYLLFPVFMLFMLFFVLYLSVIIALTSVLLKDIQQLTNNILTILFFSTPVVYTMQTVPGKIQTLLLLQPIAQLLDISSALFFWGKKPRVAACLSVIMFTVFLQFAAVYTVTLLRRKIAENV